MTSKLPYKLLMVLLIFSILLIAPFAVITYHNTSKMLDAVENIEPFNADQKAASSDYMDDLAETLISMSFYAFIIAFIVAMFFSRRILSPVKEIYRGAKSLKEGKLDVKLQVEEGDELADTTRAFNEMADTIRKRTNDLQRKESYVNAMQDPLWVAGEDNFIIDINPAFTELFGYGRDEVVGSSIFDFLDEKSDRVMRSQLRERDKGESTSYEVSIISKREGLIPVLISGAPLMDNGKVVGKLGIIKDFRQEKGLRDALRHEKDYSEAIMQSMSDSLMVVDRDFVVVKANMSAIAQAGRNFVGENCHAVFHNRKEPCFVYGDRCPAKTVFESGMSYRTTHEHMVGGAKAYHDIVAYPIKDKDGAVRLAVEILRDETEHKKLDDEIAHKNRELITLNSISRILSQSLKAEDIFDNTLDKMIEMTGMDGGGIYLIDELGKKLECRYYKGLSEEFVREVRTIRLGQDLPGRVALTGQSVVLPDISKAETGVSSALRHSGVKGYVCTPIRGKEKLLGVFYIFSFDPHVFSPEEERILHSISEMMGIAYENIRLYEKMRELYEHQRLRREEERKNLMGLSSMLSATLNIESVLAASLSVVKDSSNADLVLLLETDGTGNLLMRAASGAGLADGEVVYRAEHNTIENEAIKSRGPVIYSKIKDEGAYHVVEGLKAYNSACAIPVYIGDKALGALTLYYTMLRVPKDEDIHFLQTVGSILAVSMERARLYDDVIMARGMASAILEGIADGVMTVDTSDRVISMNRAAEGIIGIMSKSAVGMKRSNVFGYSNMNAPLQRKMSESFLAATTGGKQRTKEADLVDISGHRIPLIFNSTPVRDNLGEIVGVAYVLRDLRREKELDMLKTEFVKAVSHEFRTPLSTIVGMTEMVLEDDVSEAKAREYLGAILAEGNRLSALVSDVLDVARIESGKEVFRESEIDFDSLIANIEESFEPVIKKKRIKFSSKVARGLKGFIGDEDKLKHLMRNIVDNALTYIDEGKEVGVEVRPHDVKLRLIVRDEGWGIPDDDLRHAGEKFYRGVHAVKTTGTGLGLAICKEIAKMHGGAVHIHSRPGVGTTVTVELPIRRKK